ncbi:hypothetical protein ABMA77_08805 [Halobacteriovorax sp. RZ-1]|uniref:hypothetical protein n=1 Tax=unclassified Halobacteriovorax TaxID=2639665 RepID=UPI00371D0D62
MRSFINIITIVFYLLLVSSPVWARDYVGIYDYKYLEWLSIFSVSHIIITTLLSVFKFDLFGFRHRFKKHNRQILTRDDEKIICERIDELNKRIAKLETCENIKIDEIIVYPRDNPRFCRVVKSKGKCTYSIHMAREIALSDQTYMSGYNDTEYFYSQAIWEVLKTDKRRSFEHLFMSNCMYSFFSLIYYTCCLAIPLTAISQFLTSEEDRRNRNRSSSDALAIFFLYLIATLFFRILANIIEKTRNYLGHYYRSLYADTKATEIFFQQYLTSLNHEYIEFISEHYFGVEDRYIVSITDNYITLFEYLVNLENQKIA